MTSKMLWIALWMTLTFWLAGFWGCAGTGDDQNYEILEDDPEMFQTEPPGLQSREEIARELDIALDDPYGKQPDGVHEATPAPTPVQEPVEVAVAPTTEPEPEPVVAAEQKLVVTEPITVVREEEPVAQEEVMISEPMQVHVTEPAPTEVVQVQEVVVVEGVASSPAEPAATPVTIVSDTQPSIASLDRSHWKRSTIRPADDRTWHQPYYFEDVILPEEKAVEVAADAPAEADEAVFLAAMDGTSAGGILDGGNALGLAVQPAKFGLDLLLLPISGILQPPFITVTTPPTPKH